MSESSSRQPTARPPLPPEVPRELRWARLRTALTIAAAVLLTALILYALQHPTQEIRYRDLLAAIHRTSPGRVLIAVLATRSGEHTSELQSLMRTSYAVFCLKKKKKKSNH